MEMNKKTAPVQALATAMKQVRDQLTFMEDSLDKEEAELKELKNDEEEAKGRLR
jgi:hypothetical protein